MKQGCSLGRRLGLLLAVAVVAAASQSALAIGSSARDHQSFCGQPSIPLKGGAAFGARLGLSAKSFDLGERVLARVEAVGSEDVAFGNAYALFRRDAGGRWVKLPTGPFFGSRRVVAAGTAGPCQAIRVSSGGPGLYRVSKKIQPAVLGKTKPVTVSAVFRVLRPR